MEIVASVGSTPISSLENFHVCLFRYKKENCLIIQTVLQDNILLLSMVGFKGWVEPEKKKLRDLTQYVAKITKCTNTSNSLP